MIEPGLDRHEWESEWQGLEPLIVDSPTEALPEVHALIERMLTARGYLTEERTAADGADPEILAEYVAGSEVVQRIDAGEPVDPSEIGSAVSGYRNLYEFLIEERATP